MAGILDAPPGWQQALGNALLAARRPIAVEERFAPRAGSRVRTAAYDRSAMPPARPAATLLLVYPAEAGLATPLTVRHDALPSHPGEISLPGGAVDPEDETLGATALREAYEEVGLEAGAARIAGSLDPIWIPVSNFELLPVVATAERRPTLQPHEREVARIVELPLRILFDPTAIHDDEFSGAGWRLRAAAYHHAGLRIWGATARTLAMLATVLREAELVGPAF